MLRAIFHILLLAAMAAAQFGPPTDLGGTEYAKQMTKKIQNYLLNVNTSRSNKCQDQLDLYSRGLEKFERWAWEMFDATAKIPTGILNGNGADLGIFEECMNIEEIVEGQTIVGQYCLGTVILSLSALPQTKSGVDEKYELSGRSGLAGTAPMLAYGTCFPSGCSAAEIQSLYNSFSIPIAFADRLCQNKLQQQELETGAIITIVFLAIVLGVIVVSTIYDAVLHYTNRKPAHIMLTAFSALTNMKKLAQTSKNPNQLTCLNGIRALSLMWVVLAHRYSVFQGNTTSNRAYTDVWARHGYNMFMLGAHVSVDTFLMLGGFLITYTYMSSIARGVKFNIFQYYLHRLIRLTPPFAALILVVATLFKYFAYGPLQSSMEGYISKFCQDHWWSALLYVQNYVNPREMCLMQTWYLCADMQLFLLSPIILIPLKKKPKVGLALLGVATIAAVLSPFLIAWFYEIRTVTLINGYPATSEDFELKYNYATHARAAPWVIGLGLGYLMFQTKRNGIEKVTANKYFKPAMLCCWCVCLGIIYGCVFGWHNVILNPKYNRFEHSAQIGFTRSAWAVAVGWVIFACVHGYGGPVNWFLSLGVFQFLSKISYSMYLMHMLPMMIQAASAKVAFYFGNFEVLYVYWGDLVYSATMGLIWVLAFESPILVLEKVLFGGGRSSKPKKESIDKQNGNVQENDSPGFNDGGKYSELVQRQNEQGLEKTVVEIDADQDRKENIN